MKLVVFAHVPPPHHGQSAMVKLMLDGLRTGDFGEFEIHHVDARFSDSMEDLGSGGWRKLSRALRFSAQAIACRLRHGVRTMVYVPAPPKLNTMVRDWLVMALCRPFFPNLILHWHAVGLGAWTVDAGRSGNWKHRIAARLNRWFLGRNRLSIVLTEWGRDDVIPFSPQQVAVVGNGIPDPCPEFDRALLGSRLRRLEELRRAAAAKLPPLVVNAVFIGHCTAAKGLLTAMEAVAIANSALDRRGEAMRIRLRIAGEFPSPADRDAFEGLKQRLRNEYPLPDDWLEHLGFLAGAAKARFFETADCLCFPTRYEAESFGLVAAEALAFGIPPVVSDWRMLPELMARAGLPVTPVGDSAAFAQALIDCIGRDPPGRLRQAFSDHFSDRRHLASLAAALRSAGG